MAKRPIPGGRRAAASKSAAAAGPPARGRDEVWRDSALVDARRSDRRALAPEDAARGAMARARHESATSAGAAPRRRRKPMPADVASEIRSFGTARQAELLEGRLADAARAYARERYPEALSSLRELARAVPGVAAVRELHGLTLYRLGRWKEALRELNAFAELTGSVDQNPVIADCERALGRHARVEELWAELRRTGAGSDVLAEGRLVMVGSLADRARLADAIVLLEPAVLRQVRKPSDRHLRQWYALADLYERSGDLPRARELFRRVVDADPELSDALERLANLR